MEGSLIVPQYMKLEPSIFMGTETPADIRVTVSVKYTSIFYVPGIVLILNMLFKITFTEKPVI